MAETKQDDAEPAVNTGTPANQPPNNNTNNPPGRDQDVLQEVLALLSSPTQENTAAVAGENAQLRGALSRMAALLRDKTGTCLAMEKRIEALNVQVTSLKEVVSISKDMLNIRNMEVQHLKGDMDAIQAKMDVERQRHNEMIAKLDNALQLNGKLKSEYETQLKLFQNLREKYAQRAELLEGINNARENAAK